MLRSVLVGTGMLLAFVVATPVFAEDFVFRIDEVVGYVNSEQTNIFNPGDTLTGTSLATVHPADSSITTYYYYVRARIVDFTWAPVTDWEQDYSWVPPGAQTMLSPVASQYTIPVPNISSAFTYEVQLRCMLGEEGGPPGEHITLTSENFYFTY